MSVCAFNYFPNGDFSNPSIGAAFSDKFFSSETYLPVKNSYLLTLPDDKAETLGHCLSKLYWALFCSVLLLIALIFLPKLFYHRFSLNRNVLPDDKVVSFTKDDNAPLV